MAVVHPDCIHIAPVSLEVSTSVFLGQLMNASQALSDKTEGDSRSPQVTLRSLGLQSGQLLPDVRGEDPSG